MLKTIATLAAVGLLTTSIFAADPPTEVRAEVRHGVRMKLVPPPAPKPAPSDDEDPLVPITEGMTQIVGDLAALSTDQPVQEKQKQVVSQLDEVIKQLEEACKKAGSGGGANPTRPMADSRIAGGPGGIGDLRNPKSGTRNFGNLPAKQRDAILQSKTEGFPPGYESLLQSYYQRLAQEKTGDEPTGGASTGNIANTANSKPATRPAAP